MKILLAVLVMLWLALPSFSQNIWILLGTAEKFSIEYDPISTDRKFGFVRMEKLSEPYTSYSIVYKFELNCKEQQIRLSHKFLFNPDKEQIFEEKEYGPWQTPAPKSYAIICLKEWCKNKDN